MWYIYIYINYCHGLAFILFVMWKQKFHIIKMMWMSFWHIRTLLKTSGCFLQTRTVKTILNIPECTKTIDSLSISVMIPGPYIKFVIEWQSCYYVNCILMSHKMFVTDYVGFLRVYYTRIFHNGNFLALNFMPLFDFYIVIWRRRGWELIIWSMVTENMK